MEAEHKWKRTYVGLELFYEYRGIRIRKQTFSGWSGGGQRYMWLTDESRGTAKTQADAMEWIDDDLDGAK